MTTRVFDYQILLPSSVRGEMKPLGTSLFSRDILCQIVMKNKLDSEG